MKYSKSLDLLIAAQQFGLKGHSEKAAKLFARALAQKDLKTTLAALEQMQARNYAAEQTAAAAKPTAAQLVAQKNGKKAVKADADQDLFNKTIDDMTVEEADLDDVLELPVAGADEGNGESDLDVGNDDASDLDFSPTEELSEGEFDVDFADDLEGIDDLGDLSEEDFGMDDMGADDTLLANTTGEGDVDTREGPIEDPNDTPEGETAPTPPAVPEAEDTTVTSAAKPAGITKLNRVHANLAALRKMQNVTTAARVASPKKK